MKSGWERVLVCVVVVVKRDKKENRGQSARALINTYTNTCIPTYCSGDGVRGFDNT